MGSRRHSVDRARATITYECLGGDWHLDDQRFITPYRRIHGEWLSIGSQIDASESIEFGKEHGKVWTLIADGHVICVGGALLERDGVAELWSIPTQYIKRYPIFYFKAIRRIIGDAKTRYQLRRLQTLTGLNDVVSYNLHKHLGFKFEGVMEKYYSDGSDAIRGAMTWEL